jgi:hypothetical protein
MTARERWEHWHWTTRLMVGAGLLTTLWLVTTALFVPRREYEADKSVNELRYVRDSARDAAFELKVTRYIDAQICKDYCATRPRSEICACLRPDRP